MPGYEGKEHETKNSVTNPNANLTGSSTAATDGVWPHGRPTLLPIGSRVIFFFPSPPSWNGSHRPFILHFLLRPPPSDLAYEARQRRP